MFFENVGTKLKAWATWAFYVEAVAAIIGCFVYWIDMGMEYFFYGIGIAIGGVASAWLLSAILYGFGELIERSASMDNRLRRVYPDSEAESKPASASYAAPAKRPTSSAVPGEWVCTKCGRVNASYVGTCGCGKTKS